MKNLIPLLISLSLPALALPPDAAALQRQRNVKISELNAAYVRALEKTKARAMADGDLAGATEIDAEIEAACLPTSSSAMAAIPENAAPSDIVGKWKRDYDGSVWDFTSPSAGNHAGQTAFKVTYDETSKRITIVSAKWVNTLVFGLNRNVMLGEANGRKYRLTRIQ